MQPGQVVADRFRVEELIGEGGIGRVYRVTDLMSGGSLALKCLRPEFARDNRIKRRFMREARAVARLAHPHIVRLFSCGDSDETPYIAMELIDGTALSEHRDQGMHLDTLLAVIGQTLAALAFAHARGVIHRDVKPENIIVTWVDRGRQPFIKLLDFGFARVEDDQDQKLTQAQGDAFGTPLYMAPEQASAKGNVGPETDLYAVGVMLFEFLSGAPPFTGAHGMAVALKHVMEPVPPLVARAGLTLPLGMEEVVRRSLEKDPRARWRTAADMRRALGQFYGGGVEAASVADDDLDDQTMAGPMPPAGGGVVVLRTAPIGGHAEATLVAAHAPLRGPGGGGRPTGAFNIPQFQPLEPEATRGGLAKAMFGDPDAQALVGRDGELLWLWERAREVCDLGAGRVVLLTGQVGMGKRRLISWLEDQVAEGGWMLPLATSGPQGAEASVRTDLRAMLASVFGQLPSERKAAEPQILQALERWSALPSARPRPEPAMLGVLSATLAAWLAPAPGAQGSEDASELRGEALFARAAELLQIVARERPLLLTVSALEEAGPETLGLVAWLARWLRRIDLPILVVAGHDQGGDAAPPEKSHVAAIVGALQALESEEVQLHLLKPLDAAAIKVLLAGIAPMEPTVADALTRRTHGNPYFARELALWAAQSGELIEERGQIVLARTARPQAWPATLPETLLRRTDETLQRQLDGAMARTVLDCSSLLGERFDYELLVAFMTRVSGDKGRVERAIEVLLQTAIFGESGTLEGDRLHLNHEMLLAPLRERVAAGGQAQVLHRAAAETLARHFAKAPGPAAEKIAAHYEAAGLIAEAATQCLAAAAFRRDVGQVAPAADLLERADALLAQLHDPNVELRRAGGWLDLGELELRRGQLSRARTLAGRVYNWSRQNGQVGLEGRALLLVSDLFRRQGQLNDAARGYGQARLVFERAQEALGYARALLGAAMVERALGRLESAVELFDLARLAMESAGDHHGLARAWRGQGEIALRLGELVAARDRLELARQSYGAAGDTAGVTFCHWLLGETSRLLGQPDLAVAHFESARRGHDALHDHGGCGRAHLSLARVHRDRGRWPEAFSNYERAVNEYDEAGDVARGASARAEYGMAALSQREFDVARDQLETALADGSNLGEDDRAQTLLASLAWACAEQGDEPGVQGHLEALAALSAEAVKASADPELVRALEGVAEVDIYQGRRERAAQLLQHGAALHAANGAASEADRLHRKLALLLPRGTR